MGAGGSKGAAGAISVPFPVDKRLSNDLDKLSFVAARILNTPDIYDVNNLARPGVCGDYAVFLKKGLEKKLLPFIADISGVKHEVLYQNPRKAISDLEVRKKICGQMVDTMLRAIATVVACLASIQVASQSRETAVAAVPKQAGGNVTGVRDWLHQAGYISATDATKAAGNAMDFTNPGIPASTRFQFKLTLERTEGNVTYGLVSAENRRADVADPLPAGSLRVQFLNQIALPIPGSDKKVLPMRIVDNAGLPWAAGIFYESVFKSFVSGTGQYYMTEMFENLFRKTQGIAVPMVESREQITQANEVFQQLRRTQNPQVLFQSLGRWFAEHVAGFQAGYVPPPQPPVYGAYGFPQAPVYGVPQAPVYGVQPIRPIQPITAAGYGVGAIPGTVSLRPATGDVSYDIPLAASRSILGTLDSFRKLIPTQSSPAAVRANTLAAREQPNRTVQTAVCQDPYWREQNLSKIYPWATLQFLCVKDWKTLADDRSRAAANASYFEAEWNTFLTDLGGIYGAVPKLERQPTAFFLDQMRFSHVTELPQCTDPIVGFKEVQEGLLVLQGLHERHVKKMWKVLNDLILVIVDPDTKTEVVRLHPNVVSPNAKESSQKYVADKATEARKEIAGFYIAIERTYRDTITKLKKAA